jgi:hypothetical protein
VSFGTFPANTADRISYDDVACFPECRGFAISGSELLVADAKGLRIVEMRYDSKAARHLLSWFERPGQNQDLTAVIPVDLRTVAWADGELLRNKNRRRHSCLGGGNVMKAELAAALNAKQSRAQQAEDHEFDSVVTCLKVVTVPSGKTLIVAGDEDGVVRVWDAKYVRNIDDYTCADFQEPLGCRAHGHSSPTPSFPSPYWTCPRQALSETLSYAPLLRVRSASLTSR